jgi:hypothetical protein
MSDGQLALNTNLASPGLFFKDSNGDAVKVGPVHVGTTAPNVSPAGQSGNSLGEQWLDTSSSRYVFKIWDGTAWRTQDGEFVNTTGDTMTGALLMDNQQQVRFREATANGTNFIALQAPAAVASDKTITLPDATGTVVLSGTIVNADIDAAAAIVDTKLATIATAGKVSNSATTATDANTASAIVARSASGNFNATSINGGALAGMRNRIMNGAMTVAQRGTSFPAIAGNTYTLDRWLWNNNGSMVCTVSVSSDVPNDTFINSLKVDVTTADASIAAGEYASILQPIEGVNVRDLIGTTFTLSFWVKSPKVGVHCVSFRNERAPLPDRSYVKEYTVVTANTWEYKTVTVVGGLITAGTWNWTNGLGLDVLFALSAGTTWHTTADAWQTGNFIATANQVNVMDNTANDFFITGVQLEPGPIATPFERRPIGAELALCQRYFWRSSVAQGNAIATGQVLNTTSAGYLVELPVPLRSSSITVGPNNLYGTQANGTFVLFTTLQGATAVNLSKVVINLTGASGLAAGNASLLVTGNTGVDGSLSISAEL